MHTLKRADFLRGGLGAALGLALPGCGSHLEVPEGSWSNAVGTRIVRPHRTATPESLLEIVDLVRAAEAEKRTIRAVGSGHSFSDVALTEGYLVKPEGLNGLPEIDRNELRAARKEDPFLVRIESGMRIRDVNTVLDEMGLALENMGGYDAQTVVGAVSTGTHGSGLRYGPFSGWIQSMDVVTTGGAVARVEPSNGLTDPARFTGVSTMDERVPARLIQNDDVFQSMVISMGCMGIVYAVTLRVVPKFWLRERRTLTTWRELTRQGGLLDKLVRGEPPSADHYEILVNPYAHQELHGADRNCLLTERTRIDRPSVYDAGERPRGSDFFPRFAVETGASNGAIASIVGSLPLLDVAKSIDAALDGMREGCGEEYEAISYRVFNLGVLNEFRAWGTEFSFDVRDTILAATRVFEVAEEQARQYRRYHPAPISLRFVKAGDAYLAPQYGRDTCMIELPSLVGLRGAPELFAAHARKHIGGSPPARPHWGLDLDSLRGTGLLAELYPKWPAWERVYRAFNARGTFNGPFTKRLGISI